MSDLVVVSNRGPATLRIGESGELEVRHAAGGLAPSLLHALERLEGRDRLWIASTMSEGDREAARRGLPAELVGGCALRLVDVPSDVRDAAYRVIANGSLWFLTHGLFDRTRRPAFDRHWHRAWEGYREFNRLFASEVAERASEGGVVMVNDYHLFLVGAFLAELRPDLKTVHFTHTPFPGPDELSVLPHAVLRELLGGLAAHGAAGFHTPRWADAYLEGAWRVLEGAPMAFAAPLGIDIEALAAVAESPECRAAEERLVERLAGRQLIFRADRIELSKNLLRGFLAFEELLETEPRWRSRAVFVARAYPSRQDLPEYLAYRNEVERLVERVNERFGSGENLPIELEIDDDFPASLAALRRYDVLVVNPIRDGMNLVAKEGPAVNRSDGVVALSREAGAFGELAGPALALDPFDISGTAAVLARALEMPSDERARRAKELHDRAPGLPPARWLERVLGEARTARPLPPRGQA